MTHDDKDNATVWRYKVLPAYTHGEEHGNAASELVSTGRKRKDWEIRFFSLLTVQPPTQQVLVRVQNDIRPSP